MLGQLLFAYAFDILLFWSRGEEYPIGFGPLPIVFSTNLFLWFKDDWFYWQFVLIALGFAGKAFVKWNRDGKRVHIFNPSAFTLAIFSIVLLATGTTHLTWGQEIATTFSLGPRIYTLLFVVGLVVMYFFAITPVTAGGGGHTGRVERALHIDHGRAVLRRLRHSVGGLPRLAPARHRPLHLAAHAAWPRRSSVCCTASACSGCIRCWARWGCRPFTTSYCACRC